MSDPQFRRKRGTPTVQINVYVDPDVKDLIDHYAAVTGLPQWAIVEAAMRSGKAGPNGVPHNWDLPRNQEDLPLTG